MLVRSRPVFAAVSLCFLTSLSQGRSCQSKSVMAPITSGDTTLSWTQAPITYLIQTSFSLILSDVSRVQNRI
jgi:hypothetical protein